MAEKKKAAQKTAKTKNEEAKSTKAAVATSLDAPREGASSDLGVASVFEAAWGMFMANPVILLIWVLLPVLPTLLFGFAVAGDAALFGVDPTGFDLSGGVIGRFILVLVMSLILSILAEAAILGSLLAFGKKKFDFNKSLEIGKKFALPLLAANIVVGLIILLGLIALIIPGVILAFRYLLVPAVVVDDGADIRTAMAKSRELMKGKAGSVFFVGFAYMIISIIIGLVPVEIVNLLASMVLQAVGSALYVVVYRRISVS